MIFESHILNLEYRMSLLGFYTAEKEKLRQTHLNQRRGFMMHRVLYCDSSMLHVTNNLTKTDVTMMWKKNKLLISNVHVYSLHMNTQKT